MMSASKYYLDDNYCLVVVSKIGNQFDLIEFFMDDNFDWEGMCYFHDEIPIDNFHKKEISKKKFKTLLKIKFDNFK